MKKDDIHALPFVVLAAFLLPFSGFAGKSSEDVYKSWNYSQREVFGIIKLENTANRTFYKISKIDDATTRVQQYNPSGIVTNTTVIRFFNGKLNMMSSTNQWGETYEMATFTASGNDEFTVTRKNRGKNSYLPCKAVTYIYRNNLLDETRYLSYSNQLCNNVSGVAITRYKRYEDKNRYSLTKEQAFYDADGHPVISKSFDCHKVVYDYDENGNQLSIAYYGVNNEPLTNRYGGFKSRYQYDENDNVVTNETIGVNEELTSNSYGVAKVIYAYKDGLVVKETRYDDKNNIARASAAGDGVAIIRYEYNDRGYEIQRTYYDEYDQPVNNQSGYQKVVYQYSPSDMLTNVAYFDKDQVPAVDATGIHQYIYERDNKCRVIQKAYFDKNNNAVQDNFDQIYMVKYQYDEYGRNVSKTYWKDNITKMDRWNGYHEDITKYNNDGQEAEYLYLDQNGNLFKSNSGYSRQVVKYNADASIAERKYFDNDVPVAISNGAIKNMHCIRYAYDTNGRIAYLEYFDGYGNATNATILLEDTFDCHKIEFVYKGSRVIQENCYLINSAAPAKIIDCLKNDYVNTNGVNTGHKNQ